MVASFVFHDVCMHLVYSYSKGDAVNYYHFVADSYHISFGSFIRPSALSKNRIFILNHNNC